MQLLRLPPQALMGSNLTVRMIMSHLEMHPGLGLQNFTVETWFKRTGTGVAVSTGTNGVTAVPLVTKGSAETGWLPM